MSNVTYISEYLERKAGPNRADISKRLAEIATQQLVLASERNRLLRILEGEKKDEQ